MRTVRLWIISVALMSGAGPLYATGEAASAEIIPNHPMLSDKLVFTLGVSYPRSTTSAALAPSTGGSGAAINFEDTLNLDKRSVAPAFGVFWRATDNWRVEIEYFDISRDATRTLSQDVQWGDLTFNAGTKVDSSFDFSDLRISAAYSFFKRQDKELGIGLGLHVAGLNASIQAAGIGTEATDVTAPLPVVNLYGMFALTNKWALVMRADWLSLTYDEYSGDVRNIEMNVLYQPFSHVGFGLGVHSLLIDVEIDDPDWHGLARISFQGPTAFVTVSF